MSGTITTTVRTDQLEDLISSSRSLGSVPATSSTKRINSLISKTCKQASNLFLTRRLSESLQTLEPLFTQSNSQDDATNGDKASTPALIQGATRTTRVKVWNLYLTLLNAIIELGPEEGRNSFGSKEWRSLVAKVRDGTIWDEVVNVGYGGAEGNVDADVVSNLATLLLSHSPSQSLNQTHLETYLSAARYPALDLSESFETASQNSADAGLRQSHTNGTGTPHDLDSRIKILELYTLHVLPRNGEWEYARDFISMNDVLDEERRDSFLQTLQGLQQQKHEEDDQESENTLLRKKELEMERLAITERQIEEAKAQEERTKKLSESPQHHKRSDSVKDYGIDEPVPAKPTKKQLGPSNLKATRQPHANGRLSPASRAKKSNPQNVFGRGAALLVALQRVLFNMAQSTRKNPLVLLRTILFLVALIVALRRRDVRDRINRITGIGWDKVKTTVGMGVKVSYL